MAKIQIRYIVSDLEASIAFYTELLNFKLDMHPSPAFAMLSLNELRLVLSVPNPTAGGGQPMPGGGQQSPGGWNRFAIEVTDLSEWVRKLETRGVLFRSKVITGIGVKQIIIEDPSGNPIELFEPILPQAHLTNY